MTETSRPRGIRALPRHINEIVFARRWPMIVMSGGVACLAASAGVMADRPIVAAIDFMVVGFSISNLLWFSQVPAMQAWHHERLRELMRGQIEVDLDIAWKAFTSRFPEAAEVMHRPTVRH